MADLLKSSSGTRPLQSSHDPSQRPQALFMSPAAWLAGSTTISASHISHRTGMATMSFRPDRILSCIFILYDST